jgi:hypothetical protein
MIYITILLSFLFRIISRHLSVLHPPCHCAAALRLIIGIISMMGYGLHLMRVLTLFALVIAVCHAGE